MGEAIVLLNRVGITLDEAVHVRPPVEVEALLMSQVAQSEAQRPGADHTTRTATIPIIENRDDEAAPSWVDSLPSEEA